LASPAFSYRTAAGIAAKTHLDIAFVREVLAQLTRVAPDKPFSVWCAGKKQGERLFTLRWRKPKGFWSLPLISAIGNWLEAPVTDQNSTGRQLCA
jgi:hypothetical protein